jgi:hypothetical protein
MTAIVIAEQDTPDMAKFLSPDRARQIMRNILSHRPGRSYDCTMHEQLGVIVVSKGEQASIGEEYKWKEISEEFFNQEPSKFGNTFHELGNALKEGVAIAKGLDVRKFCAEITIGKRDLIYFLLEHEDVPCKQTSWRDKLNSHQVVNDESHHPVIGSSAASNVKEPMLQQMEGWEDSLANYCRDLESRNDSCLEVYRRALESIRDCITECRDCTRRQPSDHSLK